MGRRFAADGGEGRPARGQQRAPDRRSTSSPHRRRAWPFNINVRVPRRVLRQLVSCNSGAGLCRVRPRFGRGGPEPSERGVNAVFGSSCIRLAHPEHGDVPHGVVVPRRRGQPEHLGHGLHPPWPSGVSERLLGHILNLYGPRHDTEQPRQFRQGTGGRESTVDGGWCQVPGHQVVSVAEHVGIGRWGQLGEEAASSR